MKLATFGGWGMAKNGPEWQPGDCPRSTLRVDTTQRFWVLELWRFSAQFQLWMQTFPGAKKLWCVKFFGGVVLRCGYWMVEKWWWKRMLFFGQKICLAFFESIFTKSNFLIFLLFYLIMRKLFNKLLTLKNIGKKNILNFLSNSIFGIRKDLLKYWK